jgi:HlyD family secretion protein
MENGIKDLKIKSKVPNRLIVGGFFAILFVFSLLPFIAWLLEYKDTINAPLTITTRSTPIDVFAKTSGELVLLVKNKSLVKANTPLAVLKNSADLEDMLYLKQLLKQPEENTLDLAKKLSQSKNLNLGNLQPAFVDLIKIYETYETFIKTDQHRALLLSKEEQINLYEKRKVLLKEKSVFLEKDVIAEREFDQSNRQKIGREMAKLDNKTLLNDLDIQIQSLQREKIEILNRFQTEQLMRSNIIDDAIQLLENQLREWELTYLLKANIDGYCIYKDHLNDFQYVEREEKIFSLLPEKSSPSFGLVKLPMTGAGKVQVGQEVYVKLNNYPFMEFGVLKGVIKEISQIPFDNQYNVEVNFPDGFVSTYGISLELSPLMHGIAEVIIERKSLYNRIADQMKSMRYNR